jgi:hypothetical protein
MASEFFRKYFLTLCASSPSAGRRLPLKFKLTLAETGSIDRRFAAAERTQ